MALIKAVKQVKFGKVSVQGKEKSGKTTTAAMLAIDVAKRYHPGKPVAFLSSEPGIDYVLDMFAAEKVDVLEDRRAHFNALREIIPDATKNGCGVLLIDSATKYWQELVKAYKAANKIKGRMLPFHYNPIKEQWAEFTDQFVPAKLDIIVCGRLGYEYEELEDAEGEKDTRRIGTKMKTEGDFNYETDLIIEMEKRDDDQVNAVAVNLKGKSKKKLVRTFEHRSVHVATVHGSRVWALNGQSFKFPAESEYKVGMAANVGSCFAPYFEFLKANPGTGDVVTHGTSKGLFERDGEGWQQKQNRRVKACEEIKGALSCVFTADTGKDAATKKEIINALFETHSWTAVEQLDPEALEYGAQVCRRMKGLALIQMPKDRQELLNLVKQAKDEIHDEQIHSVNGQPIVDAMEAEANELPF
jgi:hypothetical protein